MVTNMISMGEGGSINPARVVLVASLRSAPIKRLVKETEPGRLINLTYGYPQRSVIVFENGFVAITKYEADELAKAIWRGKEVEDHGLPF